METLRKKRGVVKGCLTRLEKVILEEGDNISTIDAQIKLEKLEDITKSFEQVQLDIEMLLEEEEITNEGSIREDFETKYYNIKGLCLKKISQGPSAAESTTSHGGGAGDGTPENYHETIQQLAISQANIASVLSNLSEGVGGTRSTAERVDMKLPPISLQTFGGDYKEWYTFKDLFKAIVHESRSLSPGQKLQYLKRSLTGDAAAVLEHTKISDANYDQAWINLCNMYDKERVIIDCYIKTIMEQPHVSHPANARGIRKLYNTSNVSVSALKSLDVPIDHWNAWLVYVVASKLDQESKQLWARVSAANDKPQFKDIMTFLSNRQFELESLPTSRDISSTKGKSNRTVCTVISNSCAFCKEAHFVASCGQFLNLDIDGRREFIAKNRLCYNCLNIGHSVKNCRSSVCRICKARHHTLIHPDVQNRMKTTTGTAKELSTCGPANKISIHGTQNLEGSKGAYSARISSPHNKSQRLNLLPTAVVLVKDKWGQFKPCRVLLDSGSQVTLITESCAQYLGLQRDKCTISIDAVGDTECVGRGMVELDIQSRISKFHISSPAVVVHHITRWMPENASFFNIPPHFTSKELADPSFGRPGPIDILLKASVFFRVLLEGKLYDDDSKVIAQNTEFGFVLTSEDDNTIDGRQYSCYAAESMEGMVERFWELEEPKPTTRYLHDDDPCETHFKTHFRRNHLGRFVVRLPFKDSATMKGDSKLMAEQRLKSMERRFAKDLELYRMYKEFMDEYQQLGHMVEISTEEDKEGEPTYYLPHHAVIKPDSTTTRLRVVFDATCKPPGGNSLNSQLLTGPVLQNDLITILLQFTLNPIALSADIAKMYRQILMHPDDTRFQRILWRTTTSEKIRTFQLTTVTYGTAPASFLATRCLTQLSVDGQDRYPEASSMIKEYFYMDDFIASCKDKDMARKIIKELCLLLQEAGFNLRKWASNAKDLLDEIPLEKREPNWSWSVEANPAVKTLGLRWHPITDCFSFRVSLEEVSCYTKRNLLSEAARIFDPLGFLAPFLINYRILLQNLWQEKLNWDDQIPIRYIKRWEHLRNGIHSLSNLHLPRYREHNQATLELHAFCDASEQAYGAVVYLRSINESGEMVTSLVIAKTKVAPLRPTLVIARLELCAAVLASTLIERLRTIREFSSLPVYGWTDSSIVIHWLNGHPRRFANFVANRISAVTEVIPARNWRHIAGEMNPADCASRGIEADRLATHSLWWNGPTSILRNPDEFNIIPPYKGNKGELEQRKITLALTTVSEEDLQFLQNYSNFAKLLRVTAWVLRFVQNLRVQREERKGGVLLTEEIKNAELTLVRIVQKIHFGEGIGELKCKQRITSNQLVRLNPILDSFGILRVGGRLEKAPLGYDRRHPILLPHTSPFTKLLIRYVHEKYLHAGPQLLLALLRRQYWILGARNAVRGVTRRCITCQRYSANPMRQMMGNLPLSRLQGEKAFLSAGIDYAGPVLATPWRKRGCRGQKVYIALFICLCTKAIHLELVSDLSSDAFLAALKRFIARRGRCENLYSDNGTNFVGARNILQELDRFLSSADTQRELHHQASKESINWHFIPPSAPNFGGLWEAGVKSTKYHLRRVMGSALLTFEELQTLLCQVESCLNSRPLVAMSDSIEDFEPLTPAHFLVGSKSYFLPERDDLAVNINRLSRFQIVNRMHQAFWKRWQLEYVSTLQQRNKWQRKSANLAANDLVLIRDETQPPGRWALGRVKEVHYGTDGLARVATLITKAGLIKRPISKLCLLNLN